MVDDKWTEREAYHWAGYVLNGVVEVVPQGALAQV